MTSATHIVRRSQTSAHHKVSKSSFLGSQGKVKYEYFPPDGRKARLYSYSYLQGLKILLVYKVLHASCYLVPYSTTFQGTELVTA